MRVLIRAFACGVLLLLSACGIPILRQAEPVPVPLAASNGTIGPGQAGTENSGSLPIDEFYRDPMLTRLLGEVLAGNRELKILDEEVQIAQNEVQARRGAYLPIVTVGASAGVEKPSDFTPIGAVEKFLEYRPGKHFPDPLPNTQFGLNFFMPLDIWREFRNARDAANLRYIAASERRNYFVTRLVAEIAENYYKLKSLDKRIETLDKTIQLQQESYRFAKARLDAGKGNDLPVRRFEAEVRKNGSEKLIVRQDIIETENRINFLANRSPQVVERTATDFFDLEIQAISVGLPPQLLQNRADIRQAEREVEAAGLDILVAKAHFYPRLDISAGVGYQSFNLKYLFATPEALAYNAAGNLVAPLINKAAIKAEYKTANAKQLEAVYNYQRTILNAFTEVVNRVSKVENYGKSIAVKKQQLESLEAAVRSANNLYQNTRAEYVEVLLAQRDLLEARTVLIETKREQLAAIVNAYQALGGGASRGTGPTVEIIAAPPARAPRELPLPKEAK